MLPGNLFYGLISSGCTFRNVAISCWPTIWNLVNTSLNPALHIIESVSMVIELSGNLL